MGATDADRIWHDLEDAPTTLRSGRLDAILDEMDEEEVGAGFSETSYSGVFVTGITVWDSPAKNYKRTQATITYTGPFVDQIQKQYYLPTGAVVATVTAVFTYNANKTVKDVTVTRTRP